jgi:predicted  nucleic acid-binding Zn-ribbon protein
MTQRGEINKKLRTAKSLAKKLNALLYEIDKEIHSLYESGTQVSSQISQVREVYRLLRGTL